MGIDSYKYQIQSNRMVLLTFFVLVHLLYWKTWQAGFVTDFTGLQERLDGAPFIDFLNCFGFPALHQVTNFFLYWFYFCFDTQALPWYLIYTSLHIINGYLVYRLSQQLLTKDTFPTIGSNTNHLISLASSPAFLAALLFLVCPYNAEAVIWKVCFNFLFCTCLLLLTILSLIKYFKSNQSKKLIPVYVFFLLALFTFELALALPLIALALFFWWKTTHKSHPSRTSIWSIIPFFVLSAFYFILNKIWLGSWVGHYGEQVHLNFSLNTITSNCLKYFSKNLLFWREWNHGSKQLFIQFCDHPTSAWMILATGILILISFIYAQLKNKPNGKHAPLNKAILCWLLFILALAPLANLFVAWILHGENDRYGYFAAVFFYPGLVSLLYCFPTKIKWALYIAFLSLSIFFLNRTNEYWQKSTTVLNALIQDFKWYDSSEVYILAFPENFKGIPMFKDFTRKNLALKHALQYKTNKQPIGEFYQVAQFNMNQLSDGCFIKSDSSHFVHLEFHNWGNWWWRHGIGTGPYETDQYQFKPISKGAEFIFNKPAPDAVFIFSDGKKWKEISK